MTIIKLILHPDMDRPISYYFEDESRLDEISTTELETYISLAPYNLAIQMLLAKKLNNAQTLQNTSFINNDRSNLSAFLNYKNLYKNNQLQIVNPMQESGEPNPIPVNKENKIFVDDIYENVSPVNMDSKTGNKKPDYSSIEHSEESYPASLSEPGENVTGDIENSSEPIDKNEMHIDENSILLSTSNINEPEFEEKDELRKEKKKKKRKKKQSKDKSDKFILNDYNDASDYVQWLLSISGKEITINKDKKRKKKKKVSESARKSITKSEQIISESLADILAAQGHFSEAIKMYDQLILKFPEKSSYFAAKIDNLLKIKE